MNEAVTERLTLELRKESSPEYEAEMRILEHLCTKGEQQVPFEYFVCAYLEDYESAAGEKTIPAWRALRDAINTAWGPKYLVELDERIKKEGVEAVAGSLK